MPDHTNEPADLVAALAKAEVDLNAATLITSTGREADVAKALPDIERAKANLESALQAFVAAAYTGKFGQIGPLDASRKTEARIVKRLSEVAELIARFATPRETTTPTSADKATAEQERDRIKGKER